MKFTTQQLTEFALEMGVPAVEIVADAKDSDYNKDTATAAVHASRMEILKPQIEQDLTKTLDAQLKGKHSGEMYSILAQLSGMKRAELEAIVGPDGKQSVKEAAKKAFDAVVAKSGQSAEDTKKQIDELLATHNMAIETLTKTKDGEIATAKQRYTERDIDAYLLDNVVAKASLLPNADKNFYVQQLRQDLQKDFHVSYDEAKKIVELFKKDNPQIPALNEAGTAKISIADRFTGLATKSGALVKDMRHIKPDGQQGEKTAPKPAEQYNRPGQRGKRLTADQITKTLTELEGQAQ